jgi:outer membrane immunogenic protein
MCASPRRGPNMRLLVSGLVLACLTSPVLAADFDNSWLRGSSAPLADPPNYARWSGVYGGGQISEEFTGIDFSNTNGNRLATIASYDANFDGIPIASFPNLASLDTKGPSYGAFAGYNYQIDDVVFGFEFNFNASSAKASVTDTASHSYFQTANGTLYDAKYNVTSAAAAAISEYGTLRGRVGWAYGSFLPYVFGGLSVAQVNASSSVNVNYCGQESPYSCVNPPPLAPPPAPIGGNWTLSDLSHGKWKFGWDTGVGLDYSLTRNVFLRGEIEYVQFGSPNAIKLDAAAARAGVGLKF